MMFPLLFYAFGFMVAVMAGAWFVQRLTRNAGWVDVFWTFGTGLMGIAVALAPDLAIATPRQEIVAALIAVWSLRLGTHVAMRVAAHPEDARYVELRRDWGAGFDRKLFWFLQAQPIVSAFLAVAIFVAAHNPNPGLSATDVAGALILVAGIAGEALADEQLRRFRADKANRGRLCTIGLWAWSRHPNYFFEWFLWLAYPIIALGHNVESWQAWLSFDAPLVMYWVLMYATGVPYLETRMAKNYGAAFEAYRKRTSAFFLLPAKGES